jgi:hypothetical protein
MKTALGLFCTLILAAMGQQNSKAAAPKAITISQRADGKLLCTAGEKPCTADQVKQLALRGGGGQSAPNRCCPAGNPGDPCPCPNPQGPDLSLAPDGTLRCQKDGKPCTAAHIADLNKVGAVMKVTSAAPAVKPNLSK